MLVIESGESSLALGGDTGPVGGMDAALAVMIAIRTTCTEMAVPD